MFTGMLDNVSDVHQLTIILGHEMAHALLGHSVSIEAQLHHVYCETPNIQTQQWWV